MYTGRHGGSVTGSDCDDESLPASLTDSSQRLTHVSFARPCAAATLCPRLKYLVQHPENAAAMSSGSFAAAAAHAKTLQVQCCIAGPGTSAPRPPSHEPPADDPRLSPQVSQDAQLKLYGLYKQASCASVSRVRSRP